MIYVRERGAWYSFNAGEYRAWLAENLPAIRAGRPYQLPDSNKLGQRPNALRMRVNSWYHRIVWPADWDAGEWGREAAEFEAWSRGRGR